MWSVWTGSILFFINRSHAGFVKTANYGKRVLNILNTFKLAKTELYAFAFCSVYHIAHVVCFYCHADIWAVLFSFYLEVFTQSWDIEVVKK